MDLAFQPTQGKPFCIEVGYFDTILEIKEKIQKKQGIPISKQSLVFNGHILSDELNIHNSDILDRSRIHLIIDGVKPEIDAASPIGRPSPTPTLSRSSSGKTVGPRKLRIYILSKYGTKKIPMEVSWLEKVGELRNRLQKAKEQLQLDLPDEGYFFIYKQNVMDDNHSLKWHNVGQGDCIEIFGGSVSGG